MTEVETRHAIAEVFQALGFTPASREAGMARNLVRPHIGTIEAGGRCWRIEVEVNDIEFIHLPIIRILDNFPRGVWPHINMKREICYLATGDKIFDLHNPAGCVRWCIELAAEVLNRLLPDPSYCRSELKGEFLQSWVEEYVLVEPGEVLPLRELPDLFRLDLPNSPGAFLDLIDQVDPAIAFHALLLFFEYQKDTVLFTADGIIFGARLPSWRRFINRLAPIKDLALRPISKMVNTTPFPIKRLGGLGGTSQEIYSRNTVGGETLLGKKITLVGAGSLGGYVAQSLARLGAGQGGGRLRVIDLDYFRHVNIGRHVLPEYYVGCPKAYGIKLFLEGSHKGLKCEPVPLDARTVEDLFEDDLVINATGEQALSSSLNRRYLQLNPDAARPPFLHAWIKGPGSAVQALWVDPIGGGCFDCLFTRDEAGHLEDRYPVLKRTQLMRRIGCDLMTPYSNAAPLAGAALVTQMVSDWLRQLPDTTTFRTLYLNQSPDEVHLIKDIVLHKAPGCIACSG